MPFFLVQNKKSNPYCPYKKTAKINTTAPLQVRKCCRLFHGKGIIMELLPDAGESLRRGCSQSVPVPVLLFLSDYAYEDAGPSETDTGCNGIRGGGAESVCLCGILFP